MNANTADTYARLAICDSMRVIEGREYARKARKSGWKPGIAAGYRVAAHRARLVREYADMLIRNAEVMP